MKQLFRYLFLGTLSVLPLIIVIEVVYWVRNLGLDLFEKISRYTNDTTYTFAILLTTLIILIFLGYSIEKFGKSLVISSIESILVKIPAIRTVYSVSKKITDMFMQHNGKYKQEVVLVEYPKDGIWVPAYVLNHYKKILVLFIPTSPNPTSGYTVIVNENLVVKTTLSLEEASKFIISMGADFVKKEEISDIILQIEN